VCLTWQAKQVALVEGLSVTPGISSPPPKGMESVVDILNLSFYEHTVAVSTRTYFTCFSQNIFPLALTIFGCYCELCMVEVLYIWSKYKKRIPDSSQIIIKIKHLSSYIS
jgi:hypothetical protein